MLWLSIFLAQINLYFMLDGSSPAWLRIIHAILYTAMMIITYTELWRLKNENRNS